MAGAVFFTAAYFLGQHNQPAVFAYHIETFLVILPVLIGIIYWLGADSISMQNTLPLKMHFFYIALSLGWAVLVFALAGQLLSNVLLEKVFFFLNDWMTNISLIPDETKYSKNVIKLAWILTLISTSILAPIAEEYYFRGLLLPRLGHFGFWAPVISTVLFSIYHFWSPWLLLVRVLAIFPMVFFSWKTGNIYIALWTHLLLNLVGDSILTIPKVWG
ncbi:MAG: CPBP family intramembrane metalloprotease [Cyclobacteriaceae bacterium]|nr:CPBP family intramembrane metalloprotease [Cyclobacteriaceae bacterium]